MLLLKPFRAWQAPGFSLQAGAGCCWSGRVQPAAWIYALHGAGERRPVSLLAGAALALAMPVLLVRAGHAALDAQAAILLALGAYLRLVKRDRWQDRCGAGLLAAACLLIHPYILALVTAVLAAAPLTLMLRRGPPRASPGAALRRPDRLYWRQCGGRWVTPGRRRRPASAITR